jgi:hypothetical protein
MTCFLIYNYFLIRLDVKAIRIVTIFCILFCLERNNVRHKSNLSIFLKILGEGWKVAIDWTNTYGNDTIRFSDFSYSFVRMGLKKNG